MVAILVLIATIKILEKKLESLMVAIMRLGYFLVLERTVNLIFW